MSVYGAASISHHDAIVGLLKKDPEFAKAYLQQTLEEDANDPKSLSMALKQLADAMGVNWLTERLALMSSQTSAIQSEIAFLESRITQLDNASYTRLRDWFLKFDQARWDKEIEADSSSKRIDFLIDAALVKHENERTKNS